MMQEEEMQDDDVTMQEHAEGKDGDKLANSIWKQLWEKLHILRFFFSKQMGSEKLRN